MSDTLTGVTILDLPAGTSTALSAGLLFPVLDPNGGGPGVPTTVRLPGSLFMQATSLTYSATLQSKLALDPAHFSVNGDVLSVISSTNTATALTLGGVAITALDPAIFTQTGGVLSILTTAESSLDTAGSLTGAMQQIIYDNGVAKLATLAQIADEEAALAQPAINLSSIGSQVTGQPFQVTAVLANYLVAPILSYADDGGPLGALPAGAVVVSSGATFTHPGLGTGTHTLVLEDAEGHNATSASFAVGLAPPAAAVLANVPSGGVAGQPISGVSVTLTPSYATAYAVLTLGGADQGARQAFTGTSLPSLTPPGAGSFDIAIYAALTGGSPVTASAGISVSAQVATGATLASVPATAHTGVAISGVTAALTPSNASAYAVLALGGADEGTRRAFAGTAVPAIAPAGVGNYTLVVYAAASGGTALATSAAIAVTALATAATIAGAPANATQGQMIAGLTDTLTPANATAYVALYLNGADEGTRQVFSGTNVPSLTPQGGGNYLAKIYAALAGGTALATSGVIAVTVPATAASLAGVPATGSVGTALTGITLSLTPGTSTAYAVRTAGGVEQGGRMAVVAGALPSFTPTAAGSDTITIFASLTGGTALFTSATIAVGAALAPQVGGASAVAILDASSAASVTSDAGLNTPQGTNGGAVMGWKDSTGNGNSFSQTTAGNAGSLVTASQNGLAGILLSAAANASFNGLTAFAAAISNAQKVGGTGLTIALTFKYNSVPSGYGQSVFLASSASSQIEAAVTAGQINLLDHSNDSQGYESIIVTPPTAGALVKMIAVFDPNTFLAGDGFPAGTGTKSSSINAISSSTSSYTQAPDTFNNVSLGGGGQTSPDYTLYEIDIWESVASGTGGASPTGDIAAIMAYLTNKWGS